ELRYREARSQDALLEFGDVFVVDRLVIGRRNRILPDLLFLWNFRTEIARDRSHVAMRELVPRLGKCVGELLRILVEALGDLSVFRIQAQREIRREHRRRMELRLVVRVGNGAGAGAVLRRPLIRAGWTLGQLPLVLVQIVEEAAAPLRRRRGPGDFETARD